MIDLLEKNEPISLNPSPVEDDDDSKGAMDKTNLTVQTLTMITFIDSNQTNIGNDDEDGIAYDPTPYDQLGLRVGTPPPDWKENVENVEPSKKTENKEDTSKPASAATTSNNVDSRTALRRRQFASRRESVRRKCCVEK